LLLGSAREGCAGSFSHRPTRVRVVGRDEAVRHLGIMLGPGQVGEEARAAKFAGIMGVVLARISHWQARALTLDGRAHVASQCLASTLVYHATFSRPPPHVLDRLHTSITRFVHGGDVVGGPGAAVMHLPRSLGGRQVCSVRRQVDALQAGVIVRLLHPARQPWKALLTARLRQLPPPFAGLRSLLTAGSLTGPPSRLAGYVDGFRACMPHRLTLGAALPVQYALAEPLFGNPSIVDAEGLPLAPSAFPVAVAGGVHTVGALGGALRRVPPPDGGLLRELQAVRARLPPAWAALVSSPSAPQAVHLWWAWPAAAGSPPAEEVVRVNGSGATATAFVVGPSGALAGSGTPVPWPPPATRPAGRPCLVVNVAAGQPADGSASGGRGAAGSHGRQRDERPPRFFLVGPWVDGACAPVDPTRWGLADTPLLGSSVRQRTAALVQFDAAASPASSARDFAPGRAIRPAAWSAPEGSMLEQRERRWVAATAPPCGTRRAAEVTQRPDPHLAATAAWLHPAPSGPRPTPAVRAARREEMRQQQQEVDGRQLARRCARAQLWWRSFDDPLGGMAPPARLPWGSVWRQLHRVPAPREQRFLAWRILHGSLPCAARAAAWRQPGTSSEAARRLCHHPACAALPAPETITHIFLGCGVAQLVWQWAAAVWAAATGRPAPPLVAAVVLAGDHSAWDPGGGGGSELWHIIRLSVLHFLWVGRCQGRDSGSPVQVIAIVARVVHFLTSRMRQDAIRAFSQVHEYGVLGSELLPERPPLDVSSFHSRWAARGVLCSVSADEQLTVHLSLSHPVPAPRGTLLSPV